MKTINYSPQLVIRNLEVLTHGTGAKYLSCIASHIPGELIAKAWSRSMPKKAEVVVKF